MQIQDFNQGGNHEHPLEQAERQAEDSQTEPKAMTHANPFLAVPTEKPLIAICGKRNGYLMLAPTREVLSYAALPDEMLMAARSWAATLEGMGAPRVYWITLSEVTRHLHIHLYPRWAEDTMRSLSLFEAREQDPQPAWTPEVLSALNRWALDFDVETGPFNS